MTVEQTIREVLAHYVRAADRRDGDAMAALFTPDGTVQIFHRVDGEEQHLADLQGRAAISHAVANMMQPHPLRGWSHHTTFDPIVSVRHREATIDSQFIMYRISGASRPESGWPENTYGAVQGSIVPLKSGYYRGSLRKEQGYWRFVTLRIHHDLPFATPDRAPKS